MNILIQIGMLKDIVVSESGLRSSFKKKNHFSPKRHIPPNYGGITSFWVSVKFSGDREIVFQSIIR